MARPAKTTDSKRAARLVVRLTAAELAAFDTRVKAAGLSRIDYHRRALLDGRLTVKRTAQADPAVIAQLLRIGVNLNQLARTANANGQVPADLAQLCRTIEAFVLRSVIEPEATPDGPDDR